MKKESLNNYVNSIFYHFFGKRNKILYRNFEILTDCIIYKYKSDTHRQSTVSNTYFYRVLKTACIRVKLYKAYLYQNRRASINKGHKHRVKKTCLLHSVTQAIPTEITKLKIACNIDGTRNCHKLCHIPHQFLKTPKQLYYYIIMTFMLQPFDFPFNKKRLKINAVKIYVESLNPRRLNIEENSFFSE